MITVTTDYPLDHAGDHAVKTATAVAWDRNKHVLLEFSDGRVEWIKGGYVRRADTSKYLSDRHLAALPFDRGEPRPTRRDAHQTVMSKRRRDRTRWVLTSSANRAQFRFSGVAPAVAALLRRGPGWLLSVEREWKGGWSHAPVLGISANGVRVVYAHRSGPQDTNVSAKQVRRFLSAP